MKVSIATIIALFTICLTMLPVPFASANSCSACIDAHGCDTKHRVCSGQCSVSYRSSSRQEDLRRCEDNCGSSFDRCVNNARSSCKFTCGDTASSSDTRSSDGRTGTSSRSSGRAPDPRGGGSRSSGQAPDPPGGSRSSGRAPDLRGGSDCTSIHNNLRNQYQYSGHIKRGLEKAGCLHCRNNIDCRTNRCVNNRCATTKSNGLKPVGYPCSRNEECEFRKCKNKMCTYAKENGERCVSNGQCRYENCLILSGNKTGICTMP